MGTIEIQHPPAPRALRAASRRLIASFVQISGARAFTGTTLMLLAAVLDGAAMLLLVPLLNAVIGSPGHGLAGRVLSALGVIRPQGQLQTLVMLFVAVSLVRAGISYARDMAVARLQANFGDAVRSRLMRRLAATSWERLSALDHTRVESLIATEVPRAVGATQFLLQASISTTLIVVNGVLAAVLVPRLIAVLAVLAVLAGLFLAITQRRIHAMGREMVTASRAMLGSASTLLSGLKTACAENAQDWFVGEYERTQGRARKGQLLYQRRQATSRGLFGAVSAVLAGAVVAVGMALHAAPANLIAVLVVLARLAGPVLQLQQMVQAFVYALPSFAAIESLGEELAGESPAISRVSERLGGTIALRDVTYRHGGTQGIAHVSLTVAPGEMVGIAGPSGAGKTTLIDLLAGVLQPQGGTVTVDGVALDAAGRAAWRNGVAYLGQESFLFHDSVRRNLTWNSAGQDDERLWRALDMTGAGDIVRRLPRGLDSMIGERGSLLSGGERQRIALTRALLRGPSFLILDEATSAIDVASEAILLDRLRALAPRPSIVIIAHRRESLAGCARILHVERGTLTAR